jgi:acetyl/propionyl-CoA carboxylase alpha subunit
VDAQGTVLAKGSGLDLQSLTQKAVEHAPAPALRPATQEHFPAAARVGSGTSAIDSGASVSAAADAVLP